MSEIWLHFSSALELVCKTSSRETPCIPLACFNRHHYGFGPLPSFSYSDTHTQTAFACLLSLCTPPSFSQGFTMLYVRAGDLGQYVLPAYMSDCYMMDSCGAHAHSACFAASSAVGFYTCSRAIIKCKVGTEFESAHKHPLSVCHIPAPRSAWIFQLRYF